MDTALTALEREFLDELHAADQREALYARLAAAGLLDEFQTIINGDPLVSPAI